VSGLGITKAVAGVQAELRLRVVDRFGNNFEAGSQAFPYTFGLLLNPSGVQTTDKVDKKMKQAGGGDKEAAQMRGKTGKEDEKKGPSIPFEGSMHGSVYVIRYVAQEAGMMDLHVWATEANADVGGGVDKQGDEARKPLPNSPFGVHVSEGNASAVGSSMSEAEAKHVEGKQKDGFAAGENILLRLQVRDQFGNASAPEEGILSACHVMPGQDVADATDVSQSLKPKGGLGAYELAVEPTRAGVHKVYMKLGGQDITGSPVSFAITPAAPSSSKCKLSREMPPENEPLWEKSQIALKATLLDKYGNQLDHGGVRVDAKASGVGVSGAKTEDNKDGTYTISLTSGPPGEIKVTVRIDGNDLQPFLLNVQRNPESQQDASAAMAKDAGSKDVEAKEGEAPAEVGAPSSASLPKEAAKASALPAAKKEGGAKKPSALDGGTGPFKEVPWMTPASLLAMCEPMYAQATQLTKAAEDLYTTFECRLTSAILAKVGTVGKLADLLREWDKNGDGEMSKIEFRQAVAGKSLNFKADNKDIDAYFVHLDLSGDGQMTMDELKAALKKLQAKTKGIDTEAARLRERVEAIKVLTEEIKKVAQLTEEFEKDEQRVVDMKDNPPLSAKVGTLLLKRNAKIGDIVSKWDKNGDGDIACPEFRKNIQELGIEATAIEIDNLFVSLDTSGDGSLDLNELKQTLQKLMEDAKNSTKNIKKANEGIAKIRKDVARSHSALSDILAKDVQETDTASRSVSPTPA